LIKSPKIHVTDSGLAAHLADVDTLAPEVEEHLRGALFETYVAQNLRGILAAHAPRAELSFWHVQGRHEVDFVISWSRRCIAIEVKAATRFHERDLAGLRAFCASTQGVHAAILAYNGTEAVALGDNLFALPLGLLLS
jgi:predicted AAA+ superfamily ATPase